MESSNDDMQQDESAPLEAMLREQMAAVHEAALRALARASDVPAEHPAIEARYLREAARLMHLFVRQTEALDRRERAREKAAHAKDPGADAEAGKPAASPRPSAEEPTEWLPGIPRVIDPDFIPGKYECLRNLPMSAAEQALEAALQKTAELLAVEAAAVTQPMPQAPGYERRPERVHVYLRSLSPFVMELDFANASGRDLTPRERGIEAALQATGREVAARLLAEGVDPRDVGLHAANGAARRETSTAA